MKTSEKFSSAALTVVKIGWWAPSLGHYTWAESEPGSSGFVSKAIRVFEKISFKNKISLSTILQIKNKQNFIDYIVFEAHLLHDQLLQLDLVRIEIERTAHRSTSGEISQTEVPEDLSQAQVR